jgi:transposase
VGASAELEADGRGVLGELGFGVPVGGVVVAFGLAHRELTGITSIGVDEVAYQKGHRYATLVHQLDAGMRRLLHVSEGRSIKSFLRFFVMLKREGRRLNEDLLGGIGFVCSDMWRAYVKVIQKKLPGALHILDRYHSFRGS